jgi:TP901 family phage tail tape measure protein
VANAQTTVELIFQGVDKTAAATQAALQNLGKVSGGIKDVTQPIADFSVGALKLEAGLLAAGAAITAFAVKSAGDFDLAFREIATLLNQPIADLGDFREAILSYASTSTAPLEQVTTAIYNAISAGVPLEQSINAVATAEKLSVAGKADLNDTLRVLVSSLNAYGLGMDDADRFSDALFTTVKLGQTTLPELANALSQVTGAAAAVGVPFETVLAAISTLTAAGTPTAQAITQINAVLTSLIKPSSEAGTLAKELGIEFNAQAVKAKGLEVVLQEVATATGGNQEQMGKLFGSVEALKAVFPLTGTSAQKFATDLDAMRTSAGATDEAFGKMAGSVEASNQKIANALNGLFVAIGTPLLDEFGGIANAIAGIFNAIGANVQSGALGGLVDYIESLMGDIQGALEAVARNLPAALEKADLSKFQQGIAAVVDAVKALFGGIDITTVDGLTTALNVAGTAFLGLSRYVAGVIESFKPLFDQLVAVGSGLEDFDTNILQTLGNIGGFVTQLNFLAGAVGGLVPYLETLLGILLVKQGVGLAGALAQAAAAAPALAAALGPAALGAAALYAGTQVTNLVGAILEWWRARQLVTEAEERGQGIQEKAIPTLAKFAETTGFAAKTIDEASALIDSGAVVVDKATGTWVAAGSAIGDVSKAVEGSLNPFEKQNALLLAGAKHSGDAAAATGALAYAQAGLLEEGIKIVPFYDKATGKLLGYERASADSSAATQNLGKNLGDTGTALELTAEQAQKAAIESAKVGVELEKLASNERIKLIEARVQLNVAELQADTERVKAAFSSIDTGIESTGELLGTLFEQLPDFFGDAGQRWAIEDQIEKENQRRDQEFKLQKDLTEAQIDALRERTKAMQRGDALIKIDGAGLAPHLEAFMWEVMRAVQVRVNADGLDLLVGA